MTLCHMQDFKNGYQRLYSKPTRWVLALCMALYLMLLVLVAAALIEVLTEWMGMK